MVVQLLFRVKRIPYQPNSGSMFEQPFFYTEEEAEDLAWEKEVFSAIANKCHHQCTMQLSIEIGGVQNF